MGATQNTTGLRAKLGALRAAWSREIRAYAERRRLWHEFPGIEFDSEASADSRCRIDADVVVGSRTELSQCTIGRNTYFAPDSRCHNAAIGAFCSIGPGVRIGLGRHPSRDFVSSHPSFYSLSGAAKGGFATQQMYEESLPVQIGSDVWIGAGVLINDGVSVGHGAIVGAGAVVTSNVQSYTIVGGVPARLIRKRFTDDQIRFLLELAWWDRDLDWVRTHAKHFNDITRLQTLLKADPTTPKVCPTET